MKLVKLTYEIDLPRENMFILARFLGYKGEDLDEAMNECINPAFKDHVTPWMLSTLPYQENPDFSLVPKYKKMITCKHIEYEI